MPAQRPPTTLRLRRLATELRRLRAAAGLSRQDVYDHTAINEATLYRLETARARPQRRTLTALLELYRVPGESRGELYDLARQADEQSWLQSFPAELPTPYRTYIGFEGEAESVVNYESLFVPGLLQTQDYARAAVQASAPGATPDEIDRLVEARISRQTVLAREHPLQLWAIVDEGALHRPVGGPGIMRAQLEHLVSVADLPHVTLQVVPYRVGGHPGMAGSFAILRFGDPDVDVVYVESQAAELFLEGPADVRHFNRIVEHLRALAEPPAASVSAIAEIIREGW
ncbi:MAG TPA: helix-turn-helix transcriptional regulator [Streptosporangiaceae bacterium]